MERHRKRLDCVTDSERAQLAKAFSALKTKADPTSNYDYWAGIHKTSCQHKWEQFLPWHRAYLVEFETALQQAIDDPTVMLPYWDWTVVSEIPAWLNEPPFASTRDPQSPGELPPASDVQHALGLRAFDDFGGGATPNSYPGGFENTHGLVHNWVGGLMKEPATAAQDPIFWFLHAYVDSIWLQWQQTHNGAPTGLDAVLPGVPGRWMVKDTLDVRSPRLNYGYVACESVRALDTWAAEEKAMALTLAVPPHVTAIRFIASGIAPDRTTRPSSFAIKDPKGRHLTKMSLFGGGHHHHVPEHSHEHRDEGEVAAAWLFLRGSVTRARELPLRLEFEFRDPQKRGPVRVRSLTVQMFDAVVAPPK